MSVELAVRPVDLARPVEGRAAEVLTPEALEFVAELHRRFDARRLELLAQRRARQARYDAGESIRSLATATGRSYGFIHRILTETGVALRGRGGATKR